MTKYINHAKYCFKQVWKKVNFGHCMLTDEFSRVLFCTGSVEPVVKSITQYEERYEEE